MAGEVAERITTVNRALDQLHDMALFAGAAYETHGAVAGLARMADVKRELARIQMQIDEIAVAMAGDPR